MHRRTKEHLNDSGFTMLEISLQIVIWFVFGALLTVLLHSTIQLTETERKHEDLDWELFVNEMNSYLLNTTDFSYYQETFKMKNIYEMNGKEYLLRSSGNHVRITTPIGGTIIVLPHATQLIVTPKNEMMNVGISIIGSKRKERLFVVPAFKR